jgi:hypothetical protein
MVFAGRPAKGEREEILWMDRKRHFGLPISFTTHYLTPTRLVTKSGLLVQRTEQVLLYRILDASHRLNIWQRLFGVGTVIVKAADASSRETWLSNVKASEEVFRLISQAAEKSREERRIVGREMYGAIDAGPPHHC